MTRLGDIISISHEYEKIFFHQKRVKIALFDLYQEIHVFIEKIRTAVLTKCERLIPDFNIDES